MTLGQRSRGGGSVTGVVDDGVANMVDDGTVWCSSGHGNRLKVGQGDVQHREAYWSRRRGQVAHRWQ
jgi:hypothetical protein